MASKKGRPVDAIKSLRKKYTTMLNPSLMKRLKMKAIEEGKTAADVLENLLKKCL